MWDVQILLDRLLRWDYFVAQYWNYPWLLRTTILATGAIIGGTLLCLYGARLLRTVYMFLFLALGAMIGVRVARGVDVDVLIGLVLGAGLSALVGYLLFRCWVGLSVALAAVVAVALSTAPWFLEEAQQFADALLEQTVGQRAFYAAVDAEGNPIAPQDPELPALEQPRLGLGEVLRGFMTGLLEKRPAEVKRLGIYSAVAALIGLAIGMMLPRLTIVVGTTLIGAGLLVLGTASVVLRYFPGAWDWYQSHRGAVTGGFISLVVLSILHQARLVRRPKIAALPSVAPASPKPA